MDGEGKGWKHKWVVRNGPPNFPPWTYTVKSGPWGIPGSKYKCSILISPCVFVIDPPALLDAVCVFLVQLHLCKGAGLRYLQGLDPPVFHMLFQPLFFLSLLPAWQG